MHNVAIIGRPNTGKSTLFNRIIGRRTAITDKTSGVTRDRMYAEVEWAGHRLNIIDTGGVETRTSGHIKKQVFSQIKISIEEADTVFFLTDVGDGVTPMDKEISRLLRTYGANVVVGVNKVDNEKTAQGVYAFSSLGWDRVIGISAMHGTGINKLLDTLSETAAEECAQEEPFLKTAVIGRPNAGKSTFVNAAAGYERMIVDEKPGTTRDAVDIKFKRRGQMWMFIDTAGIRKKGKVKEKIDYYSVTRAYKSIVRADVIILMIDTISGMSRQDMHLLSYAAGKEKPCIIAVNKWDLVRNIKKQEYERGIRDKTGGYRFIPVLFISSLKKRNINGVLDKITDLYKKSRRRAATRMLNKTAQTFQLPARVKIYYCTQYGTTPPSFIFFTNIMPKKEHKSYIENQIHKRLGLDVPIRLSFRPKA